MTLVINLVRTVPSAILPIRYFFLTDGPWAKKVENHWTEPPDVDDKPVVKFSPLSSFN